MEGGPRKSVFMSVIKLVHVTSSNVFQSTVTVKIFTENVSGYFENNSSKQTLSKERRTEFLLERINFYFYA